MDEQTEMRFTRRHDRAILELLQTSSPKKAAKAAGVSQATMTRYLKHPAFAARLEQERKDLFMATKTMLLAAAAESVETLLTVQRDPRAPWTAKVAGARSVLGLTIRIRETEIADQLDRLEDGEEELIGGEVVQ